jgi:hypothetical protein
MTDHQLHRGGQGRYGRLAAGAQLGFDPQPRGHELRHFEAGRHEHLGERCALLSRAAPPDVDRCD